MARPELFALSSSTRLRDKQSYRLGLVQGLDLGSAVAVLALAPRPGDLVADMCTAPGAKMLLVHDLLVEQGDFHSPLWANDVSVRRLAVARRLLDKAGAERVRTVCGDARQLDWRHFGGQMPNKIIADVECTHDGSFKHVRKLLAQKPPQLRPLPQLSRRAAKRRAEQIAASAPRRGASVFEQRLRGGEVLRELIALQKAILQRALELVAPGGRVVYSTCSLCPAQNEEVVQAVLAERSERDTRLLDLATELGGEMPALRRWGVCDGGLPGSLRLDPTESGCGGFFIAALEKRLAGSSQLRPEAANS